jgi:octaprenyl-diphosphate synthase
MNPQLQNIKHHFKEDLKQYDRTFAYIMSSDVKLVDNIAKYIVRHRGKGLRPLLVIMSARLLGEATKTTFTAAAIVEILHTASLVHDDVVDDSAIRRGLPSVNALWKNKISVLMGDYLLAKTLINATQTGSLDVMQILAESAKRLSKGELFQIEKSRKLNINETEYLKLVSDKTAALISACCELGALSVSKNSNTRKSLKEFGENLGIAFQIKDDLLDYESHQSVIGKPAGADLKGKKITLPLILSMESAPAEETKVIIKLLKKGVNRSDIKRIISFSAKYGGIDAAKIRALQYADQAKAAIKNLPASPAKEQVIMFVDYVINRSK